MLLTKKTKQNKTLPYPLEYVKDQHSIGTKEISGEWARGNCQYFQRATCLTYPGREFIYAPSYSYTKLKE